LPLLRQRLLRVQDDARMFDLHRDAIAGAITRAENRACSDIRKPSVTGRTIYLSPMKRTRHRLRCREYNSRQSFIPRYVLLYTYGKTLLTPGQAARLYALPPTMPQRERLRDAVSSRN